MLEKTKIVFWAVVILCGLCLISCGRSQGGEETTAELPEDTVLSDIGVSGESTEKPKNTDIIETTGEVYTAAEPETDGIPETDGPAETNEGSESTQETEKVITEDDVYFGLKYGKEITDRLTLRVAPTSALGTSAIEWFESREELDAYLVDVFGEHPDFDWDETSVDQPVSLSEIMWRYHDEFFENNVLIYDYADCIKGGTVDKLEYASISEKEKKLEFYFSIRKYADPPEDRTWPQGWDGYHVFIEVPRELINSDITYTIHGSRVSDLRFYAEDLLDKNDTVPMGLGLIQLMRVDEDMIDQLLETKAFRRFLSISKNVYYEDYPAYVERGQWVIDTLEKCNQG